MENNNQEKSKGLRYNEGKIRFELLPSNALKEWASVMTYGANKYTVKDDKGNIIVNGANNWRNGLPWMDVYASALRHLEDFKAGIDNDSESGLKHLGHAMCNIGFLMEYYKLCPELDNRNHSYLNDKRIGLDIDGVLANFTSSFNEEAVKLKLYPTGDYSQQHWNFPYEWETVWNSVIKNKDFWIDLKPLCEHQFGFEPVAYVTSRSIDDNWTKSFLSKNNFPPSPVYKTDGKSKVQILKDLKIDIFVDDCYENFVEINKAGICCYLFDQPYNRKYNVGYKRIYNLKEIV